MKFKRLLSCMAFMFISCFANAGEGKNETSIESSNTFCFWIFCESDSEETELGTLGIGIGDPPGPDTVITKPRVGDSEQPNVD